MISLQAIRVDRCLTLEYVLTPEIPRLTTRRPARDDKSAAIRLGQDHDNSSDLALQRRECEHVRMEMHVSFPGGVIVKAHLNDNEVITDQPAPLGTATAMSPFDLFFASLATCMGFYALRFCQERSIGTEGLGVTLSSTRDPEKKLFTKVQVSVKTPESFPDKYRDALLRAVDQCAVKKHVVNPPEFAIELV